MTFPKELAPLANRALFRRNPFRILQVPTFATSQALRQSELILRMAEKGIHHDRDRGSWPLDPPPTLDAIQASLHTLSDPLLRFIWEFFWIWPEDYPTQVGLKQEDYAHIIDTHNQGVLNATMASDLEADYEAGRWDDARRTAWERTWPLALKKFFALVQLEEMDDLLLARIHQIDDSRLTSGWATRIRQSITSLFTMIFADLTANDLINKRRESAILYSNILKEYEYDQSLFQSELINSFKPIERLIKDALEEANSLRDANSGLGIQVIRIMSEKCKSPLLILLEILGDDNAYCLNIVDKLIGQVFRSSMAFGRDTEEWDICLEDLNELIAPFCLSRENREKFIDAKEQLNLLIAKKKYAPIRAKINLLLAEADKSKKTTPISGVKTGNVLLNEIIPLYRDLQQNGYPESELIDLKDAIAISITNFVIGFWNVAKINYQDTEQCIELLKRVSGWFSNREGVDWYTRVFNDILEVKQSMISSTRQAIPNSSSAFPLPSRTSQPNQSSSKPNTSSNGANCTELRGLQHKKTAIAVLGVIIILICVANIDNCSSDTPTRPIANTAPESNIPTFVPPINAPTPIVATPNQSPKSDLVSKVPSLVEKPFPMHGTIRINTQQPCIAPFKIETPSGQNYIVKLITTSSGRPIVTCYIKGGKTLDIKVPLGTYIMKYATGYAWYGEKLKFGPNTIAKKMDTELTFYVDGNYVTGHTISLSVSYGGNLKSTNIDPTEL